MKKLLSTLTRLDVLNKGWCLEHGATYVYTPPKYPLVQKRTAEDRTPSFPVEPLVQKGTVSSRQLTFF